MVFGAANAIDVCSTVHRETCVFQQLVEEEPALAAQTGMPQVVRQRKQGTAATHATATGANTNLRR